MLYERYVPIRNATAPPYVESYVSIDLSKPVLSYLQDNYLTNQLGT